LQNIFLDNNMTIVLYMIDSKANIILLDNNMTIVLYCI